MREQVQKEEANLVKQLKEKGMQVTTPNVADFKAKRNAGYHSQCSRLQSQNAASL